jgi:hypothetical protein
MRHAAGPGGDSQRGQAASRNTDLHWQRIVRSPAECEVQPRERANGVQIQGSLMGAIS